ncbi:MAG: saccharopine dehydrogenase NADP-binding domain-containing protein [Candidatus Marinimicrobia bacterium]|nr:saccharopine dehydrogenase NADP-binding domain-containing protein [Candidatus Neomarinimicrobiota bacterium]MBL7059688.1 saccharopine dehydrogenase NADP-binding domain-containing protein [Candidatus Neomarinimicrobiota bacterium]
MKNILVLGAGLVSRPGVRYMLEQDNLFVTVASRTVSKAEALVEGYNNGKAIELNVNNADELVALIKSHDIVISLLPWIHHVKVAELCLEHNTHMATTSYVSEGMNAINQEVKDKGLLFLNEIGVDPGIDHMSAMKIIDEIHDEGGKILHFYSYCGGLPAPDDNDNPFGYKFSWSPKGVVLASRNSAKFLENGDVVDIEGKNLFLNSREENVEGLGMYEIYPNRDSLPYKDIYGLKDALTVMRGTYRNLGWCRTLKAIVDIGLVDDTVRPELCCKSYKAVMETLIGKSDNLKHATANKLNINIDSDVIERFEWLGLFSDDVAPNRDNYLDILSDLLQEKLFFKEGEKDMIILQHKFTVENKDGSQDFITSTLIDYGIPHGDSSMARTVSLPLAIGVTMMANGKINLTGVQIPNMKEIYEPVLDELENLNIKMVEKRTPIN